MTLRQGAYLFGPIFQLVQLVFFRARVTMRKTNGSRAFSTVFNIQLCWIDWMFSSLRSFIIHDLKLFVLWLYFIASDLCVILLKSWKFQAIPVWFDFRCFEMLYCPNTWSYWLYELKRFMRVSSTTRAGGKEYSWSLIAFSLDSCSNKRGVFIYENCSSRRAIHLGWMWAFKVELQARSKAKVTGGGPSKLVKQNFPPPTPSLKKKKTY